MAVKFSIGDYVSIHSCEYDFGRLNRDIFPLWTSGMKAHLGGIGRITKIINFNSKVRSPFYEVNVRGLKDKFIWPQSFLNPLATRALKGKRSSEKYDEKESVAGPVRILRF